MKTIETSVTEVKFYAICDFFNSHNVMSIEDFNDICDDVDKENGLIGDING